MKERYCEVIQNAFTADNGFFLKLWVDFMKPGGAARAHTDFSDMACTRGRCCILQVAGDSDPEANHSRHTGTANGKVACVKVQRAQVASLRSAL